MANEESWMRAAIEESLRGMRSGAGGPFGAVVVHQGQLIARGHNSVLESHDPTAHAEINAIRIACQRLGTHRLDECDLYASCEPCPMCLGAIHWSRLQRVYFGNSKHDAEEIGFDDQRFYEELGRPPESRSIPMIRMLASEAKIAFDEWRARADRQMY